MGNSAVSALSYIIGTVFDLYAVVVAIRFLMQVVRANYYNPLAQFVVKVTDPLLKPLRRFIPGVSGYDIAALVLCLVIIWVKLLLISFLNFGAISGIGHLLAQSIPEFLNLFFNIFIWGMVILAVLSWIAPDQGNNPVVSLLHSLTDPILRPVRNFVPPVGGLDLSMMVAIVGLVALRILTVGTLTSLIS